MDPLRDVNPDPRRALPSVDTLSRELAREHPELAPWAITAASRSTLAIARAEIAADTTAAAGESSWLATPEFGAPAGPSAPNGSSDLGSLVASAARQALRLAARNPRPVVNATGVVLHTNLGRAPLPPGAAQAAAEVAAGYSSLELDLDTGRRGDRLGCLTEKLSLLSGAEAGYACNNNAAAVLLALNTLALGREVVVSRGELVEIGGSFRIPEILERAGVRLVEVGTTNRTHPRDYEDAIGPNTGLLLKVHRSNFEQRGFVTEVGLPSLVAIGGRHGIPIVEDLGSGTLLDLTARGLPAEACAPARIQAGADLVCFSGDKLLGGPQAGIVLGRREVVAAMRANPLARALRLDKMTLAALDWVLDAMLSGRAENEIPTLRMLLAEPGRLEDRARALAECIMKATSGLRAAAEPGRTAVGGGSLPGFEIDTWVVAVRGGESAARLARGLRAAPVPVLARVRDDLLILDVRTLEDEDVLLIEEAFRTLR